MKNSFKHLLVWVSVLTGLHAQAATLLVKEYGANNTYASVQAAITAAANNDTILVYDKPSGQLWIENITIDKNLWIANADDNLRFKLQGNITIVPLLGMKLFMVGYNLVGGGSIGVTATGATATSSNRATILLSDGIITGNVSMDADWFNSQVAYSNITGSLTLRHGTVLGNTVTGGIIFNEESTTVAQNDSILVIGNIAPSLTVSTKEAGVISNNYFSRSNLAGVVTINSHNPVDAAKFIISNNTILNSGNSGVNPPLYCGGTNNCYVQGGYSGFSACIITPRYNNTLIVNNILGLNPTFSNGSNTQVLYCNCNSASVSMSNSVSIYCPIGSGQPLISHNIFANAFGTAPSNNFSSVSVNNEFNQYGNYSYFGTIDAYGRAAAGNSNCINKGLYLGQYYDIDLTRNDVGTYGGPYSIDNFIGTSTSKGRVTYINVPHQLSNINQQININATGISKF